MPTPGQTFEILTCGSLVGEFSIFVGLEIGSDFYFDVLYSGTDVTLVAALEPVPGDLNDNGVVDGPDYAEVLSYWSTCPAPPEPPDEPTPEPATPGLLLIGGLALLMRRHKSA